MNVARRAVLIGLLCCYTGSLGAQVRDKCEDRVVLVNVTNKKHQRVSGLTAKNFRGSSKGLSVTIASASRFYTAPRVILLLDTSGSMRSAEMQTATRVAIDSLIRLLPPESEVALVTFAVDSKMVLPFSKDRTQLTTELARLYAEPKTWQGRTNLFQALTEAARLFGARKKGDAMVLITDGIDEATPQIAVSIGRFMIQKDIRVFAVLANPDKDSTPFDAAMPTRYLERVVKASGGISPWGILPGERLESKDSAVLWASIEIASRIYSGYALKLELGAPLTTWTEWKLEILEDTGKVDKQLKIEYPSELAPCGGAPPARP